MQHSILLLLATAIAQASEAKNIVAELVANDTNEVKEAETNEVKDEVKEVANPNEVIDEPESSTEEQESSTEEPESSTEEQESSTEVIGLHIDRYGLHIDRYGCNSSTGSIWCEHTKKCYQPRNEECEANNNTNPTPGQGAAGARLLQEARTGVVDMIVEKASAVIVEKASAVVSQFKDDLEKQQGIWGNEAADALGSVYEDLNGLVVSTLAKGTTLAEGAFAELAEGAEKTLSYLSEANNKITQLSDDVKTTYQTTYQTYKQALEATKATVAEVKEAANDTNKAIGDAKALSGKVFVNAFNASTKRLNEALQEAALESGETDEMVKGNKMATDIADAITKFTTEINKAKETYAKANAATNAATTFTTLSLTAAVLLLAA